MDVGKIKRDEQISFYVPEKMRFEEWKGKFARGGDKSRVDEAGKDNVDKSRENGIINAGAISGARNPYGKAAEKHSKLYYEFIRKTDSDIPKIAQNTGYSENFIAEIKQYLFVEVHDLGDGMRQFDPDFMIAQSWQRLIDGKNILPHDITLLLHEELERKLMSDGMSQHLAHIEASQKYNYSEEAIKFYASIKKYKKE